MANAQGHERLVTGGLADGWSGTDRSLMLRALELAALGKGQVSPGPLVGCVIADETGQVFGEGSYLYDRIDHAETIALRQAGGHARGATAYVSLEPHAHHARTPPCTAALIEAGIARVVVPIEDPNPRVSGAGLEDLRKRSIKVDIGLLEKEAARLNEKYIHFAKTNRPFVHLKLACSLDGRVSTRTGDSRWITGEDSRRQVQNLRHEYDSILVGIGTVLADDPSLTDRSGMPRRRPLIRVVLDTKGRLPQTSKLAVTAISAPVLVFMSERPNPTSFGALPSTGIEIVPISRQNSPGNVLDELGSRSIQSVLVEGGAKVSGSFIDSGLIDKVSFFIAPIIIGGVDAPCAVAGEGAAMIADAFRLTDVETTSRGPDVEITGYPQCGRARTG